MGSWCHNANPRLCTPGGRGTLIMIPEERSDETVWPESQLIQFSISSSVLFARLPGLYRAPEGQQASLQKSTWTPLRI